MQARRVRDGHLKGPGPNRTINAIELKLKECSHLLLMLVNT